MADFGAETSESFRTDVRDWLKAHFPASLKGKGSLMYQEAGLPPQGADGRAWTKAMGETGWGVPSWPKAYGGGGLSAAEARDPATGNERRRRLEPHRRDGRDDVRPDPAGIRLRGAETGAISRPSSAARSAGARASPSRARAPTSPRCRPSARTRATTGWSTARRSGPAARSGPTGASAWCARTRRKKHEGISFLLIDMKSPGIEVRPIRLISGNSPFCETFFTDVKVPKENLVGPLGGGWAIAKRLLQHERSGPGRRRRHGRPRRPLRRTGEQAGHRLRWRRRRGAHRRSGPPFACRRS